MRCHRKSGSNSSARRCRSISPPVLWFARMQKYRRGCRSVRRYGRRWRSVPASCGRSRPSAFPGAYLACGDRAGPDRHPPRQDRRPAADLRDLQPRGRDRHRDLRHRHPRARPRRRLADRARLLPPGHGRHRRRGRGRRLGLDRALVPARRLPAHRRGLRLRRSRGPRRRHRQGAADRPRRPCPLDPRDLRPARPDRPAEPGQRRRPRGGRLPVVRDPAPLRREARPDPRRRALRPAPGEMTPAECSGFAVGFLRSGAAGAG